MKKKGAEKSIEQRCICPRIFFVWFPVFLYQTDHCRIEQKRKTWKV